MTPTIAGYLLSLWTFFFPFQTQVIKHHAGGGGGGIAFVQRCGTTVGNGNLGVSCTFSGAVTTGDLIVVGVGSQQNTAQTITASGGCTIGTVTATTHSPEADPGSGNFEWIYYATVSAGSGAGTCNIQAATTGAPNYHTMAAYELSGQNASPFVIDVAANGSATTAITSGTVTVSGNSIIIAQLEASAGGLSSFGAGYTGFSQDNATALNGFVHDEYHAVSSSEAATATQSSSSTFVILAAAFH